MNKWSADELRQMYESGMSQTQIAKTYGVGQNTISKAMKRLGVTVRPRSKACLMAARRGPSHHLFKHGKDSRGYTRHTAGQRETLAHRAVASSVLGRPLSKSEEVHHCNEQKDDNRIENLWVFPSKAAHARYHKTGDIHSETIFLKDYA